MRRTKQIRSGRPLGPLIELVVVLGIIALLAWVLFPVLKASEGPPRQIVCRSHLRQLYVAFQMYAADNDDRLPPYDNRLGQRWTEPTTGQVYGIPERGVDLVLALQPYIKTADPWYCPVDSFAQTDSLEGGIRHWFSSYRLGVRMVDWLGPIQAGKKGTPVAMDSPPGQDPADAVLLTDNLWGRTRGEREVRPPYSHNERYNYLFFDGHTKAYRRSDPDCPSP